MVAEVKITSNTIQIANEIKGISQKMSSAIKKSLANVSAFEIKEIRSRTQTKGVDAFGRKFKPYSPNYKRAGVKQSGVVDLKDTGQMFSSLTSKITASKGELFFRQKAQNDKAAFHDIFGVGKKRITRQFFRISKDEQKKIRTIFSKVLARELKL
tara:strand:+ start:630 stop:1094 length:465 start_codon:yes stop_codon:yes gene_type:complete